jgi:hypothetical protein
MNTNEGQMHPDDYRPSVDQMGGYSDMQPKQNNPREMTYLYQAPTHVVVDTIDGYVFKGDASGQLFDGQRAVAFALARNNEQNPGFKSYMVFRLVPEVSFEPVIEDVPVQWNCQRCGQGWPAQTTAQIISQNAKAAVMHPGEECLSDEAGYAELNAGQEQCDTFDCDDEHPHVIKLPDPDPIPDAGE